MVTLGLHRIEGGGIWTYRMSSRADEYPCWIFRARVSRRDDEVDPSVFGNVLWDDDVVGVEGYVVEVFDGGVAEVKE